MKGNEEALPARSELDVQLDEEDAPESVSNESATVIEEVIDETTVNLALEASDGAGWPVRSFDHMHVIVLKRDATRLAYVQQLVLTHLPGAHIFPAVDGRRLTRAKVAEFKDLGYLTRSRPRGHLQGKIRYAKIACFMSHIRLWEQLAISTHHPYFLILEDDAYLASKFHERYEHLHKELLRVPHWDMVFLCITRNAGPLNTHYLQWADTLNKGFPLAAIGAGAQGGWWRKGEGMYETLCLDR